MIPEVIGRYRVLELVGQGAMGTVYRCRDESLERDVAVKVMSAAQSAEPAARARFIREARAAARLKHPNIITIYELRDQGTLPFIAMEFLEGVDLQRAITAGIRPDPTVTLPIVLQVLAGLAHAHEHDIVHRDIKPSNVFLPRGRPAKIMDFGVARLTGGTTTAGTIVGTPNYMSPEQVVGGPADGRSDLFSTGLILYELVTGERAYTGASVVAILYKIANERPDLSLLPRESPWAGLRRVITRALAQDPRERYPDAHAMSVELSQALADLGGSPDWASASDRGLLARHTMRMAGVPVDAARTPPAAPKSAPPAVPDSPSGPQPGAARVWHWAILGSAGLCVLALLAVAAVRLITARTPPPAPRPAPPPAAATQPQRAPTSGAHEVTWTPPPPTATVAAPSPNQTPHRPTPPAIPAAGTPRPSGARTDRASALLEAGRFQAALNEARTVLAREPENEEARAIAEDAAAALAVEDRLRRAHAAESRGEHEKALAEVRAGLALAPNDARLLALERQLRH